MVKVFPAAVFQSFETKVDRSRIPSRVAALRQALGQAKIDAFLVPRADAHRDESVPASEARLAYISGFTGSAGLAIVGLTKAGLFVDSRYTLQAPAQTDQKLFRVYEAPPASLAAEIGRFVPKGGRIGYDPWLHTSGEVRELEAKLDGRAVLVPTDNLVDRIWHDRPAPPASPIEILGDNRAGRATSAKLEELRDSLAASGADAAVLTLPESICWLFNIRGRDTPNTPFVLGYAIVPRRGRPTLFLDAKRSDPSLDEQLGAVAQIAESRNLMRALGRLGKAGRRVLLDPQSAPAAVSAALAGSGAVLVEKRDPILLPKSKKNAAEIGGMREAHKLDGVALAKFLAWFDGEAPNGHLTEIDVVTALEAFRREESSCIDASFDTIAGAGPDGAIVHYRVTEETDRGLAPGELMLVDSGAQYLSGTTDITRTLSTGPVTAEQKDRYTRVLKGMIGIAMARFPKGTSGAQLDILARQHLWQAGVTYNHGTGHGVGAFLSVHEGPIGISTRYPTPFEAGMIVSDEPGYYKAGEYGIRIENLVMVVESAVGDGKFLEFETLTLAPIDTRPIEISLLSAEERDWLNAYHARVLKEIGPLVKGGVLSWLRQATRPI
jgi:Xaa-Pro aminopeptidase